MRILKTYLLNCMFHGWAFVADDRYHWTERLFWIINIIASWYLAGMFMMNSYYQFENDSVSFTVDTLYLNWTTKFPAIIFCEKGNEKYHQFADQWFKPDRNFDTDEVIKDIAFFKGAFDGITYKCMQQSLHLQCPPSRYTYMTVVEGVRSSCSELFGHCTWREEEFDCCSYFLPLNTIYGVCYAINSIATHSPTCKNRTQMEIPSTGKLSVSTISVELLHPNVKIFTLSSEEVPTYNSETSKLVFDGISVSPHLNEENHILLRVEDTVNEPEVESLSIEKRNCRYPNENYLQTSKVYSYPACIIQCLKNIHLNSCNCTHHLMPSATIQEMCDLDGLFCLSSKFSAHLQESSECTCLSSCIESKISILGHIVYQDFRSFKNKKSTTKINFTLYPPAIRYIRKIITGYLDLIVYMGGLAGLFAGASVLTIVDFFYYFIVRPYNDARVKRQVLEPAINQIRKEHKHIPFRN
ncbi:sodium channel protein Nach-like [Photinus pyralis]|nr:sodium channel protein Nach-like [Photinus pyralis]